MINLDSRFLILVVAVTVFVGLLAGWAAGVITEDILVDGIELIGTLGFVAIILFILVISVIVWFALEEQGERAD